MSPNAVLLSIAIIGFSGQIATAMIASYLNQRAAKQAKRDADQAEVGIINARKDALKAQAAAAEAARLLVESAKTTDAKLSELKKIGQSTHTIVNNQRTMMLKFIAQLTRRIANENPNDAEAMAMAIAAEEDARNAATGSVAP